MGLPQQEQHDARYQHADQEIGRVHHRLVERSGEIGIDRDRQAHCQEITDADH